MHAMWKEVSGAQNGVEEGIKGAVPNGLGLGAVNGTGLPGGNPLLPASMMGLNGLAHEAFQFPGLWFNSHCVSLTCLLARNSFL